MYSDNLFTYINDGRPANTKAVIAYLSVQEGIEPSWNGYRYTAEPAVNHWENGRDRGYVITLKSPDFRQQLNISVFEHRNSDDIIINHWEGVTFNVPTVDDMPEDHVFVVHGKTHYDAGFSYDRAAEAAAYISDLMEEWWIKRIGETENQRKKLEALENG